jgi:hypothetical protein
MFPGMYSAAEWSLLPSLPHPVSYMLRSSDRSKRREAFPRAEAAALMAPDAEVAALFPHGELRLDTHSSLEEGMLDFDFAARAKTSLVRASYDCIGMG